jgi:uncharacterized delta-60 repeat protein
MRTILIVSVLLFRITAAVGQGGNLDTSFSEDGQFTHYFTWSTGTHPVYVGMQPDGKIIVSGTINFPGYVSSGLIGRFNVNGTPDNTFGSGGFLQDGWYIHESILQPDGKILVSVNNGIPNYLTRYNVDGGIDQDFFSDLSDPEFIGSSLAVQTDGKIVVGGSIFIINQPVIKRYQSNGIPDSSFGINGTVITSLDPSIDFTSVSLQTDGKIIAAGFHHFLPNQSENFVLIRYLEDGEIDSNFGIDGMTLESDSGQISNSLSVALQTDGKILFGSSTYPDFPFSLTRFNVDGSIDSTFGLNGTADSIINMMSVSIALQPDGKIVAGGSTSNLQSADFVLLRYNMDGTPDTTFGTSGLIITDFDGNLDRMEALVIQADGKIVITGSSGIVSRWRVIYPG